MTQPATLADNGISLAVAAEPKELHAGASATWERTASNPNTGADYSAADGYAVVYEFSSAEDSFTISGAAVTGAANVFTGTLTPALSADYVAGMYTWRAYATKSGEKWCLATGAMEVLPDISGTEFDGRSHARRVLDGLEALIEGRSTTDVTSLSVRGRSISRMDITELLRWRDKYRTFVRQEADAQAMADGRSPSTKILVRLK